MIHLSLRATITLTLLFALALALVHYSLHDDDGGLLAFFAPPPGCAAPCFMGIRPGVTTRAQASAILVAQPWVGSVTDTPLALSWMWNGQQPTFVSDPPDDIVGGQINFVGGLVYNITLSTATNWGQFFGAFGAPDHEFFQAGEDPSGFYPYIVHSADYTAYGFEVETNTLCPFSSRADLWYSPVSIVLPSRLNSGLIPVIRGC